MVEQAVRPRVTLDAERLIPQNSDLTARAVFDAPNLDGVLWHPLPDDARFVLLSPGGMRRTYTRGMPETRINGDVFQLAARVLEFGHWHVRVEGTVTAAGQRVLVAAETLVNVTASAFP